jgi:hypothetical protein
MAERYVDIVKRQLAKCSKVDTDWLDNSMLAYRNTPNASIDGQTPADLFLGRSLRTQLSLLKPAQSTMVNQLQHQSQRTMEQQFNRKHGTCDRKFNQGDKVFLRNYFTNKCNWLTGVVVECKNVTYRVFCYALGRTVHRHANQLRARCAPDPFDENVQQTPQQQINETPPSSPKSILKTPSVFETPTTPPNVIKSPAHQHRVHFPEQPTTSTELIQPRRSERNRKTTTKMDPNPYNKRY